MEDTLEEKSIEIRNAALKEMSCNYGYELLTGKTKGDVISRKGLHEVHEDLQESFKDLDVFIAHIDGAFHWSNNQTHLGELEEHEDLANYRVLSFKFSGAEENKAVVLTGEKDVTQGIVSFSTPKIKLQSPYLYIEELNQRLDKATAEVELYMEGKTAPQYEQSSMEFLEDGNEDDFENAKVE